MVKPVDRVTVMVVDDESGSLFGLRRILEQENVCIVGTLIQEARAPLGM